MERGGASIDMVTRRPKEAHDPARAQIREARKEQSLRKRAADLNLVDSPEGQRFIELLEKQGIKRLEELIAADPAASSIQRLLEEMGYKYSLAKRAIEELHKRQFR